MKKFMIALFALMLAFAVTGICEQTPDAAAEEELKRMSGIDWESAELEIKLGDQGLEVMEIARILAASGCYPPDAFQEADGVSRGPGGEFDELMRAAVINFQKEFHLPQTGVIDAETLEALSPGYAHAQALKAQGYLMVGDEDEKVKEIQESLITLGYYAGSVSGHFGVVTQEAVMAYQKANGLTEDGCVGPELIERMRADAAK